jgi:hypothetical protein
MSRLMVPRECAQVLEERLPANEEEGGELLPFETILTIGGSLLPSEDKEKKPLMENCLDELDV